MHITLDEIKAAQIRLTQMIEAFETQATAREAIILLEQFIDLGPGEHYAGIITGQGSEASYHLILMSGDANDVTFSEAQSWAKQGGGALPTRREQALLYANCKDQFEAAWYWSCEQYAGDADYAWGQDFSTGYQDYGTKGARLRARAVRRLVIE